jgi:hypothetical protein
MNGPTQLNKFNYKFHNARGTISPKCVKTNAMLVPDVTLGIKKSYTQLDNKMVKKNKAVRMKNIYRYAKI